jgi:hypothetical protein
MCSINLDIGFDSPVSMFWKSGCPGDAATVLRTEADKIFSGTKDSGRGEERINVQARPPGYVAWTVRRLSNDNEDISLRDLVNLAPPLDKYVLRKEC